jgi:hypothetical protein
MASGHVNRTKRPNTWLHRPACGREESPCQLGTGRALQAGYDDLEMVGLALLYPALEWSASAPGHHGYPRTSDLILGKALNGR